MSELQTTISLSPTPGLPRLPSLPGNLNPSAENASFSGLSLPPAESPAPTIEHEPVESGESRLIDWSAAAESLKHLRSFVPSFATNTAIQQIADGGSRIYDGVTGLKPVSMLLGAGQVAGGLAGLYLGIPAQALSYAGLSLMSYGASLQDSDSTLSKVAGAALLLLGGASTAFGGALQMMSSFYSNVATSLFNLGQKAAGIFGAVGEAGSFVAKRIGNTMVERAQERFSKMKSVLQGYLQTDYKAN